MDAKEKLKELLGDRFPVLFSNVCFEERALIVQNAFQAQQIEARASVQLRIAFGFVPEIKIGPPPPAIQEAPPAQVLPIERAKRRKIGFAAREMVLLNLPHSDQKQAPIWTRQNGNLSLMVQGGYRINPKTNKPEYVGIPYGPKARLILFYLMTEAKLTNSRRIHLGNSFNAFLEALGTDKNRSGKKSGRAAIKGQVEKILRASFMVQHTRDTDDATLDQGKSSKFVEEWSLWFSKKSDDQLAFFDSYIDLSRALFESIQKAAIPLDWDVLLKLKDSALAIDLYALLTYEAARAQHTGRGRFIPWAALMDQIGGGYGTVKNFSAAARVQLSTIKTLYPALKLGKRAGGLDILPESLPSVENPKLPPKD